METASTPSVSCNKCGAALQVSEVAHFVSCRHCGASLEIRRSESALWTEISRLDQRDKEISHDVGSLQRDVEINRLDLEWAHRREQLMIKGRYGPFRPTVENGKRGIFYGVLGSAFGLACGVFFLCLAGSSGIMAFVVSVVGACIILAISCAGGSQTISAARVFDREEAEYLRRRNALLNHQ